MRAALVTLVIAGCAATPRAPVVAVAPVAPVAPVALRARPLAPLAMPAAEVAPASTPDADDRTIAALVAGLAAGDLAAVAALFDPQAGVTAAGVAAIWQPKQAALGRVTGSRAGDRSRQDGLDTRGVILTLERGELACLVAIDPDGARIASLSFARPAPPAPYLAPARVREVPITVAATARFPLPGTLALPATATATAPVPAVVLVHGSGPNDRDETTGANRPFADLAGGLASAGIAVLRYDKRTFRYGDALTNAITIDEEVVDDAVAAVHALAARPEIDPHRIFVIGHSLGGMLAPEIARRATGVAGVVLLAPPARAPWDIVLAQMRYLGAPRSALRAVETAITLIDVGGGEGTEILGVPFAYWRDWASRDGIAAARALGRPVLVLRGDRDYQVLAEDFDLWRRGLAGAPHAELVTLPGDNHLFLAGTGRPGPAEYKVPGHVDARVIDRIVAFVRAANPIDLNEM